MKKRGKKSKVSFSIILVIIMVLTSFAAFAEPNTSSSDDVKCAKEDLKEVCEEKITEDVKSQLSKDEYTGVLIYLKDRVDTEKVSQANAVGKTLYEQKMSSRRAVVSSLKNKAESTQASVIKYLEQQKEKGNVTEIEPYYIINMIYAKADKETIENISYMDEVEKIFLNKKEELVQPEKEDPINQLNGGDNSIRWNIENIGADQVWNMGIDGTGVVVGLIDTGTDWTHEALKEKWRGYNPNDPNNPNPEGNWFDAINGRSMPYDESSIPHGTHVMGTILGRDPQGNHKIGVAPGAKWITAKAFSPSGGYDNWILSAAEFMLAPNGDSSLAPDIINNSWGGGSGKDEWFRDMVKSWRSANILPVFSAGNESYGAARPGSISVPANYPECFAVAAVDINNNKASFSQMGPSPYGDIIKPEISAPGVSIYSSVPGGYDGSWSGTSMACPHIVGTAALILSANNSLTIDEIEDIIMDTANPLTDSQYKNSPNYAYGYGLVNAFDAVMSVSSGRGTIKGKASIAGEDEEEPEIIHEPKKKLILTQKF